MLNVSATGKWIRSLLILSNALEIALIDEIETLIRRPPL
jgi:hypothetical protein